MSGNIRPDLPPVQHSLRCLCRACCDARRDEAQSRLEEQRRERSRGAAAASCELRPVLFSLRKARPGTLPAIAKRYGRSSA